MDRAITLIVFGAIEIIVAPWINRWITENRKSWGLQDSESRRQTTLWLTRALGLFLMLWGLGLLWLA